MKFLSSILADWHYGRASSKMEKGQYGEAIELLKKILTLEDKSSSTGALTLFDLGYCYLQCKEKEKAFSCFSESYMIFEKNKKDLKDKVFYNLLRHYSHLLRERGEYSLASEISNEAEQLKNELGSMK